MANPDLEASVFVEFYTDALELKYRSEEEGRPIFEDRAFVRLLIPGDTTNQIERVATDADKHKYPKAWARYVAGEKSAEYGTPLEQWPQITRAQMKEAKYFEIHTVENMAGLSDSHLSRLGMGFMDLRNKAKAYLDAAAGTAIATKDAAEKARMQSEIDDLKAQIAELAKPRRGRPAAEPVEA